MMAQWVKELAAKPANLGLNPGTYMMESEPKSTSSHLTSMHISWHAYVCMRARTHTHK